MEVDESIDTLFRRYGSMLYYEDIFYCREYHDVRKYYKLLEDHRKTKSSNYEYARQSFLKLLSRHEMVWIPTDGKDRFVEITRIHSESEDEYLAYMRLKPLGYRAERRLPQNVELSLHLIFGRVSFKRDRRQRVMNRGNFAILKSRNTYEIRNLFEQISYIVLKVVKWQGKEQDLFAVED